MPSEEVVPLYHLVPRLRVWFTPDALPVAGDIGAEDMLLELLRIGIQLLHELADAVGAAVKIVVSGHEQALHLVSVRRKVLREHLAPCGCMELHLGDLSGVRHVAKVQDGIHVVVAEAPQRGDEPFVGPVLRAVLTVGRGAQVRVAHNAEYQVRLTWRSPSRRCRKEPCAKCGGKALQESRARCKELSRQKSVFHAGIIP